MSDSAMLKLILTEELKSAHLTTWPPVMIGCHVNRNEHNLSWTVTLFRNESMDDPYPFELDLDVFNADNAVYQLRHICRYHLNTYLNIKTVINEFCTVEDVTNDKKD